MRKISRNSIDAQRCCACIAEYFHVASSYGISESRCYRKIKWIEETLIKHPDFALPGRKALLKSDMDYEVVLIDATQTPIERPKKNKVQEQKAHK